MRPGARGALTAAALVVLLASAPAAAQGRPERVATDISTRVMSPFCPGLTLHDCPSGAAARLRARIESWARAGRGQEEIMARLETEFGPEIDAAPEPRGLGLVAWLLPAAGLALGGVLALVLVRRWTSGGEGGRWTPGGGEGTRATPTGAERARLRADLDRLREGNG